MQEICGNCKYNKCTLDIHEMPFFYCDNVDGAYYGVPTAYDDSYEELENEE